MVSHYRCLHIFQEEETTPTAEDKLVAARNEENSRASAEEVSQPQLAPSTTVIEKPLDPSSKLVYHKGVCFILSCVCVVVVPNTICLF